MTKKIAFQGVYGAYSHIASMEIFPNDLYIPCSSFKEVFIAVQTQKVDFGVIPVENSNAGRVTDVHFLLAQTPVNIVSEHFLRINHQLLGLQSTNIHKIKEVHSHPQALSQCSDFLQKYNIVTKAQDDTAFSCQIIQQKQDETIAAIASSTAAKIYNLKILASDIENSKQNTTRFLVISKQQLTPVNNGENFITSLIFQLSNSPSSLHKALGYFAEQNLNLIKIESYLLNDKFTAAKFYIEIETHQQDNKFKKALKNINKIADNITILGTYKSHNYRDSTI